MTHASLWQRPVASCQGCRSISWWELAPLCSPSSLLFRCPPTYFCWFRNVKGRVGNLQFLNFDDLKEGMTDFWSKISVLQLQRDSDIGKRDAIGLRKLQQRPDIAWSNFSVSFRQQTQRFNAPLQCAYLSLVVSMALREDGEIMKPMDYSEARRQFSPHHKYLCLRATHGWDIACRNLIK
jgi:hypothetical protein